MANYLVTYADQSMIDAHLAPYELPLSAGSDAEATREAIRWIARLKGVPAGKVQIDPKADGCPVAFGLPWETPKVDGWVEFHWLD